MDSTLRSLVSSCVSRGGWRLASQVPTAFLQAAREICGLLPDLGTWHHFSSLLINRLDVYRGYGPSQRTSIRFPGFSLVSVETLSPGKGMSPTEFPENHFARPWPMAELQDKSVCLPLISPDPTAHDHHISSGS